MRQMIQSLFFTLGILLALSSQVFAGGGPENLLLVVNADSPSSLLIANHYIALRGIPERNVVYLADVPDAESIRLPLFKTKILKPILDTIQERKLTGTVDYIVYSADFPSIIQVASHTKKLFKLAADQGQPLDANGKKLYHPNASINSLTYFAHAVMKDEPAYLLLDANYYYRGSTKSLLTRPFSGDDQAEYKSAVDGADKDLEQSIESMKALQKKHPRQLAVLYHLARFYARSGDAAEATKWLRQAAINGWSYRKYTQRDKAFTQVLADSEFRNLLSQIPDDDFQMMPTVGFKQQSYWSSTGSVNGTLGQGRTFFLSTVLAVTRNQGCTERQALAALKANAVVDGTQPEGTFFFADTKDVRNRTRKPNYAMAIRALNRLGMKTRIIKDIIPLKQSRVMGLTNGTPRFNWKTGGSNLIPGAICDNLTSHGGMLDRPSQTKCTEFIAAGAAGASGTVVEPFAIQAKFPHPMIHAHYARGCSLAESFYQSVHGPYQLLIVGDALCQPFATIPSFDYKGLEPEQVVTGAVEILLDDSKSPIACKAIELYIDGQRVGRRPMTDKLQFDSRKLSDGYHEIRIVVVANSLLETTGRAVIPIFIDNEGHRVDLTTVRNNYKSSDQIKFKVESNYGERIVLKQNSRELGKKSGKDVEFSIAAETLGRGPITLTAVAFDSDNTPVSSVPIRLNISGEISNERRNTRAQGKQKAKK